MEEQVRQYMRYLEGEEKSMATRQQYKRDIARFFLFMGNRPLTRELVISYKQALQESYLPATVNVKLAALNGFFSFMERDDLKVKRLRMQSAPFCAKEKELTRAEYLRLLAAAKRRNNKRLYLLLQAICGTGIRVSELKFITVQAVRQGEAIVQLKGKTRVILIPGKLKKALREYIRQNSIASGPVFVTKSGRPLDRSNIWKMMKALCKEAGVNRSKVFPHNLRHLFARSFYGMEKDIAKLADILGHSSINTTRVYIMSSGSDHRRRLDALGLVV